MDLGLKGKKVIMNGGARGIGLEILKILTSEGADVAFFSRDQGKIDAALAVLAGNPGKAHGDAFDMTGNIEGYVAWLNGAVEKLGGCDIFINMASVSGAGATQDWQKCLDVDIMAAVKGIETLTPALEASGAGSIIVMSSTAVEKLDEWPDGACVELTKRPVQSVTSVTYLDLNGNSQTWSSSLYSLDLYRPTPAIALAYNELWPNALDWNGSITITYVVGHANAAAVPKLWKQAMLMLIGHWFENRSAVTVGGIPNETPIGYERIAMNFRRFTYP